MDLSFLPAVNAGLNAVATVMLVVGYVLIRQRRIEAHRAVMISAFSVSCLFLALYVLHKMWRASTGDGLHTEYHGVGFARTFYLVILLTHLVLAMIVPILAIALIWLGLKRKDAIHRRIGKVAFPIWMYVSITGVLIYFMLYQWNPVP